jgi:hypothetical protein
MWKFATVILLALGAVSNAAPEWSKVPENLVKTRPVYQFSTLRPVTNTLEAVLSWLDSNWFALQGATGATGETGAPGAPGADGLDGVDGASITNVSVTIEAVTGGKYYHTYYYKNNGTAFGPVDFYVADGLKGDKGDTGAASTVPGPPGANGTSVTDIDIIDNGRNV